MRAKEVSGSKVKIVNSLTGKKETFKPLREGHVSMYVCGATVYDEPHIGHARSAFVFDVIRRYLKFCGYQVKHVRNVTDVDDKIIEKARQGLEKGEGLKEKTKEVAEKYLKRYQEDMAALGIGSPDIEPKATLNIDNMQQLISKLIRKGFAYKAGGSVYFDVRKFKTYGKLSKQNKDKMLEGVRIESDANKRSPLDFALWKQAKAGEPSWKSPWGDGRPGWHIECSAMSMKYLGVRFDIHAGGRDLIFPHHENEIAQSKAALGSKSFANYWMHNGLLTIDAQKMSKSLGNFVSIKDILAKYQPEDLKLFFLTAHYRSPIDFTFKKLDEAKSARERFGILFSKIDNIEGEVEGQGGAGFSLSKVEGARQRFFKAMDDDFNTADALGSLFELVSEANERLSSETKLSEEEALALRYTKSSLIEFGQVLGIFFSERSAPNKEGADGVIDYVVKLRDELRHRKLFDISDNIRKDLEKIGVVLEDGKERTLWRLRE